MEHLELCAEHKGQGKALPWMLTERQPRKQGEKSRVVLAAARNCIYRVAKQDLNRGWQRGEWHIL